MITRRGLLMAMAGAATALSARPGRGSAATDPESLATLLEPIRAHHRMPALAGAYVSGTDLTAIGAVGDRRVGVSDPVNVADRFHLGSCTKSMTATLIARMVEEGGLGWQTTVGEVFADQRETLHPAYRTVTVLHLLSHQSGLPEDRRPVGALWARLVALTGPLPGRRRALMSLVLKEPPVSEPGQRMAYSNYGYVIMGAMAEQVTGQSWEDLMRRRLFDPLGMASAGFGAPGRGQPWGHSETGCQPVSYLGHADNPEILGPAGTVHSTLTDWARYASLHLAGARGQSGLLLRPESFEQLHRDHFGVGYALGWQVVDRSWARGRALTHSGSNRRWHAVIWVAPARNAAFLAAANCGVAEGFRACDDAVAAMIRRYR